MRKILPLLWVAVFWLMGVQAAARPVERPDYRDGGPFDYQEKMDEYLEEGRIGQLPHLIPPAARELLPDRGGNMEEILEGLTPQVLLSRLLQMVRRTLSAPLRLLTSLIGVILLCAVLGSFNTSFGESGMVPIFNVVICVFISGIIIQPVVGCIVSAASAIREFSIFILTFIPIFAGVVTAAGQPMTGAAYNLFVFAMCQWASQLITKTFVPLLCAYLSLSLISAVCPKMKLSDGVAGIKTFVTWCLGLVLTLFVGLLTIQSVVAAGGDSITIKTTKFFIGSLVPVVGGALADVFMAAQGCIQLVKGTVGAFGVAITLLSFLPILLQTATWYMAINLGGIISTIFGVMEIAKLLKAISATLGVLMAVILFYALLVIISTTLLIVAFRGS